MKFKVMSYAPGYAKECGRFDTEQEAHAKCAKDAEASVSKGYKLEQWDNNYRLYKNKAAFYSLSVESV